MRSGLLPDVEPSEARAQLALIGTEVLEMPRVWGVVLNLKQLEAAHTNT